MNRFLFFVYVVCLSLEMNAQKIEQYYMAKETSAEAFQKYVGETVVYAGNIKDLRSKDALTMTRGERYKIDEVGETTSGIVSFALTSLKDGSNVVQHASFNKRTAYEYGVLYIDELVLMRCKLINDATKDIRNKEYKAAGYRFKIKEFYYLTKTPESPDFTLYATFEDVDNGDSYTMELKDFQESSINVAVSKLPEEKLVFLQAQNASLEKKVADMKQQEEQREKEEQKAREEKKTKSSEDEVVDIDFPIVAAGVPHKVFIELVAYGRPLSTKVTIDVDFGQAQKFFDTKTFLIDKQTGKKIVFNSMVDAMNYFGRLGWEFEQAYVYSEINKNLKGFGGAPQPVYHWLLSKTVTNDSEITQGIITKKDLKK